MWKKLLVGFALVLTFPMTVHSYEGVTLEAWQDFTFRERLNYVTGCVQAYTRLARSQGKEIIYNYRTEKLNVDDRVWELVWLPRVINSALQDSINEDSQMKSPVGKLVYDILEITLVLNKDEQR